MCSYQSVAEHEIGAIQAFMPHMCRISEDGNKSHMHAEISKMKRNCRGSLNWAVLAAETDLRGLEAGNKRKPPEHFGAALLTFARRIKIYKTWRVSTVLKTRGCSLSPGITTPQSR